MLEICGCVIVEIGGTGGDIESLPFLEAIRQFRADVGRDNVIYIHLIVPYISTSGEVKTKPTQHSVKELRSIGIQPDILLCRTDRFLSRELKAKIALYCNVGVDAVITGPDHYMEWGESPGGLRYFIMGGGGAPVYANENQGCAPNTQVAASALPWLDDAHSVNFADSRNRYMTVAVNNGQVDVEIKDVSGNVLDAVSWNTGDIVPSPDAGVPDAGLPDAATPADAGVPLRHLRIGPVRVQSTEHRTDDQITEVWRASLRVLRLALVILLGYVYLQTVLTLLPWSYPYARLVLDNVLGPLRAFTQAAWEYAPNLAYLAVLAVLTRFGLRLVRLFFQGIE